MLPLKACDGRQAVLMVALLSGCQADSSCLAMINQVRKMIIIVAGLEPVPVPVLFKLFSFNLLLS